MFAVVGCSNVIEQSNNISLSYIEVDSIDDVIYNLRNSLKEVKAFKFNINVIVNDENYELEVKVINRGTIENSVISISYLDNFLIINENQVYIDYKYKGYDITIKDSLDNFVEETVASLEKKGIKCNKERVYSFIKEKTIDDIYLENLSKFVYLSDDKHVFKYENLDVILNDSYLPKDIKFNNDSVEIIGNISYDTVSITIPTKHNLLSFSIKDIKKILKIENISDLIKKG